MANKKPDHSHHEMTDCNLTQSGAPIFGDISKIPDLDETPVFKNTGKSGGGPIKNLLDSRQRRKDRINKKGY